MSVWETPRARRYVRWFLWFDIAALAYMTLDWIW